MRKFPNSIFKHGHGHVSLLHGIKIAPIITSSFRYPVANSGLRPSLGLGLGVGTSTSHGQRLFHTTRIVRNSEKNKDKGTDLIEGSMIPTDLVEHQKKDAAQGAKSDDTSASSTKPKKTLMQKIKHEINHYKDGTKLLGYEIKVSFKLLLKLNAGYELTRRESAQLSRTLQDLMRLIPFLAFILIPFAELLLPIALKFFPNLLPSTYESTADRDKKKQNLLKTRKKTSNFIQQTMSETGLKIPKKITDDEKRDFIRFFQLIQSSTEKPTREHLLTVARFFKNDQVLDNLSRPQLIAMCRHMNLRPFGTDPMLRYQIRYRLLQLMKDDKAIDYEGVESLSLSELSSACASRGIQTSSASPARLRDDLKIWLELRLRQKIPSTLLILSSTFTYGEHADDLDNYYDALLAVLSSIPDEVYNVTKAEIDKVDNKLKLDVLKEQDELIKEENEQQKEVIKDDLDLNDFEEDNQDQDQDADHNKKEDPPAKDQKQDQESAPEANPGQGQDAKAEAEVDESEPEDSLQRSKYEELEETDAKSSTDSKAQSQSQSQKQN